MRKLPLMDNVIIMWMWIKEKREKSKKKQKVSFSFILASPTTPRAHSQIPHSRLNGQIYLTHKKSEYM